MATIKEVPPIVVVKKQSRESLTPHRFTVGILIMEYYKVREVRLRTLLRRTYIRDFCLLILKLIQCPDLSIAELNKLLNTVEYSMYHDDFIVRFHNTIRYVNTGIGILQDCVDSIGQLMLMDNQLGSIRMANIARNSVVGCYLRRLVINFDKLSFSEISSFYESYKEYCGQLLSGGLNNFQSANTLGKAKSHVINRDWSQRQAELFIATQSSFLANNEGKAYQPNELQKYMKSILKSNPELASAHFLNYLNYLRVKEYCGAVESLHHCFDISNNDKTSEEKTKTYRYAALNLAILQCQFGHKTEGLQTIKESIKMAQEAGDNLCLQHALSWLRCLTNTQHKMAEHSVIKCLEMNLSYVMCLGIQSVSKYCGLMTASPFIIFDTLSRSDVINSHHGHGDLVATNYGLKAGLWLFYGKTEMCSLWSQLLLHLNSDNLLVNKTYYGESYVQALCNVAGQLHLEGEYGMSNAILAHAEERFPHEPESQSLMLCRHLFNFQRLLYNEKTTAAEAMANNIGVVDKWESHLCLSQLYLHTGDYEKALIYVNRIIDECRSNNQIRMDVQVRAMILIAEIQVASNFPNAAIPGIMGLHNSSLAYANDYSMNYLAAIAQLHIAHVLFLMKMPEQALKVMHRCIIPILSDGGCYDRARALMLYANCKIACSGVTKTGQDEGANVASSDTKCRKEIIIEALQDLEKVHKEFDKIDAVFRVKDVLVLQAKLCDEIGWEKQRNRFALEYRTLRVEHPPVFRSLLYQIV